VVLNQRASINFKEGASPYAPYNIENFIINLSINTFVFYSLFKVRGLDTKDNYLTLWRPAAFGDFRKKTPKHTSLCTGISPFLFGLRTWSKRQNT